MTRISFACAVAVSVALTGCEPPRESTVADSRADSKPEVTTPSVPLTSPTVDTPAASSGTTQEGEVVAAADEQMKKTVNPNADMIWGDWAVDSATLNGEPMPNEVAGTISLYIDEVGYTVNLGDQVDKGTVVVHHDSNPKQLDISGVEGPNAGKTILAIFEQEDSNSLVVCYAFGKDERPTEFSSTAENRQFLVKYKRKVIK